jgi:hypothetical protein
VLHVVIANRGHESREQLEDVVVRHDVLVAVEVFERKYAPLSFTRIVMSIAYAERGVPFVLCVVRRTSE